MILNILKNNNFLIYTLALLPLLSLGMVGVAIILFALGAILNFSNRENEEQNYFKLSKVILIYSMPFALYLIALLWTDDHRIGLRMVEKTLSFIIIPVIVFVFKPFKTSLQLKRFSQIFVVSCVILVVVTMVYLLFNLDYITTAQNSYFLNIRLRQSIEQVPLIGEHPIYFSLLIALGLLLLFYNRFKNRIVNITLYSVLILGLIIASSRGVILALLVVIIFIAFPVY